VTDKEDTDYWAALASTSISSCNDTFLQVGQLGL
jgi:hypothetical protein